MGEATETVADRKRALLEAALRKRRQQAARALAIPRRGDSGPAPLSFAQQRIWFLEQWEPGAPTFNGARATRLRGELDVAALHRAFETIVERHESLRSVVAMRGREPSQVALETWSLELPVVDLQSLPPHEQEEALARLLRELSREPFDLAADLMLRVSLIRLAPDDAVLLVRMHHIAADGFSDRVLFGELRELYDAFRSGRAPELPELPLQYADYAVWQRERLSGPLLEELTAHWTDRLEGAPALLRLPIDRPRRTVQRHEGVHHELRLSKELADGIVALSRGEGVTVFMAMLAAFSVLLYRVTGEDDIVVGCPIANRTNAELEGLIGLFSNTIALRSQLAGNPSFREVLARVRETTLAAYAHQELPFEKLVEALRVERDAGYNPLFQVNFRAQAGPRPALELPGLASTPLQIDIGFSRFDLALELQVEDDGVTGFVEYDEDLFDRSTAVALVEDFEALLEQALAAPETPILALRLPHGRASSAKTQAPIRRARQTDHS
jgi:hypothetical protein